MKVDTPLALLTSLFTSLDHEELYVTCADNPEACAAVDTLSEAARYIDEEKGRGVFVSTGTFQPGTARKQEHLLCCPLIVLDADLKDCLEHGGMADAEAKVRTCSPTILAKLRTTHLRKIDELLTQAGIEHPSAIIFTGGGHHIYVLLDFLQQREIARIRAVHKRLVHRLNAAAGYAFFDPQVIDAGTRYMRVPGTANLKCSPVRWAEVVANSGPTYTLRQLEAAAGISPEQPATAPQEPQADTQQPASDLEAIVTMLTPYWTPGRRHALALSLAGYLASAEWHWKAAKALFVEIGKSTQDEEIAGRLTDLKTTYQRLAKGETVKGFTALATVLSAEDLAQLAVLVGIHEIPIDDSPPKLTLITRPYSEIQERDTSWTWYPYLPARNITSVEGNPGEGKSWITTALCAAVSIGKMPFLFSDGRPLEEQKDRDLCTPANVLHLNIEDDPEETIKKRLRVLGADCSRVFCIEGVRKELTDGSKVIAFTVDQIAPLEDSILSHKARLVILDPIQAYLPRGADMNKAESMRPLLGGLMQLARRTGCTILLVRHFGKRMTDNAIHKAIGSIDFAAAVRSVLIVGRYPKEKDSLSLFEKGVVTHAKSNLAPRGLSLDFHLQQDSFTWVGTSTTDASDFTRSKDPKSEEDKSKEAEAIALLKAILSTGHADRGFILEQGQRVGLSDRTIDRASYTLRLKKTFQRDGNGKIIGATWALPPDANDEKS